MPEISKAQLIALGESQHLEFKKSLSLVKEGFSALCAMVNSAAGRGAVVFGISPTHEVIGLGDTNLDSAQRTLAQHASQKVDPALLVQIELLVCEGKYVLVLSAQRLPSVSYHEYGGRAYIRQGSENRTLSVAEKQQLVRARDRNLHNGPWICRQCNTIVGMLSNMEITDHGVRKSYTCGCGGEYWPAI